MTLTDNNCNTSVYRVADVLAPVFAVAASFVFGFALASLIQSF